MQMSQKLPIHFNNYKGKIFKAISIDGARIWDDLLNSTGLFWAQRKGLYRDESIGVWSRLSNATFQVADNEAKFHDNVDTTKAMEFQLDQISTGNTRILAIPDISGTISLEKSQIVTVAKSGAQFTSIKSAIDSIIDASVNKLYTVLISSGNYTETGLIEVPPYVTVKGIGAVTIKASNTSNNMFNVVNPCYFESITIQNCSSAIAFNITLARRIVYLDFSLPAETGGNGTA